MTRYVLGDDHGLWLRLVHEGQEVGPLLVRDYDLVPLVHLEPHGRESVLTYKLNPETLTRISGAPNNQRFSLTSCLYFSVFVIHGHSASFHMLSRKFNFFEDSKFVP